MTRLVALVLGLVFALVAAPAEAAPKVGYQTTHLSSATVRLIKSAPCKGGRVDVIVYSATRDDLIDAAIGRAKCGAKVRVLTSFQKADGVRSNPRLSEGVQRLVDGVRRYHGTVVVAKGALARSYDKGLEHEKIVAVHTKHGDYVESSSGNWTYSNDKADNDSLTVRDSCLYRGVIAHMDRLASPKLVKKDPSAASCDKAYRMYFYPVEKVDPVLAWAKKAKCGRGDTVVFANFYFTTSKGDLTTYLIRFKHAGAKVRVAANDRTWSVKQGKRLQQAGVEVRDVDWSDADYGHRKMLAASGCKGGPVGFQGSTTMNSTAYRKNGNQVLRTTRAGDVRAMIGGFSSMVARRPIKRF